MPHEVSSRQVANPDTIDLGIVGRAVLRALPFIGASALTVGVATAFVLSTMAPKYLSAAQLEVRATAAAPGAPPDKEAVGTHVRALMSTGLALAMAKTLHLTERPEFNSALPPASLFERALRSIGVDKPKAGETDEDRLMQAYFQNVRAYQVRETRSIIVDCTTPDAKFSATCANTLADLYRASLAGRLQHENTDVTAKLAPEVTRLAHASAEAEARVAAFRASANLFQANAQAIELKDQQLADLSQELTRATAARIETDARSATARTMAAHGLAAANPDVRKSILVPQLEEQRVALERQIAELGATLLPGHPRMKQLTSELAALKSQIAAEVQKVVAALDDDARIAAAREALLHHRIDELKLQLVSSAPDTAKLADLENDARSKRAELDRVRSDYQKAVSLASTGAPTAEIEIVSRAYPSNEKVFPKIGSMSAFATVAACLLGLALVVGRAVANGARSQNISPANRTAAAGAPIDSARNTTRTDPARALPADTAATDLLAATAAVRRIRVLVAPDTDQRDASETCFALARALAEHDRRVVTVFWPDGAAAPTTRTPGVAQLLSGDAHLADAVQPAADADFDVITTGGPMAAGYDADTAAHLLDELDEHFDVVLVTGTRIATAQLFETLQGRFDAGVLVSREPRLSRSAAASVFLGFKVPDFDVVAIEPSPQPVRRTRRSSASAA